MTFEQGVEKGYDKLPQSTQKKLKAGKSLTANEENHKNALEDLEKDRQLPSEERVKWMLQFQEEHMDCFSDDDDDLTDANLTNSNYDDNTTTTQQLNSNEHLQEKPKKKIEKKEKQS